MFSKFFKNNKTIVLSAVLLMSALSTNYFAADFESGETDPSSERRFLGTGSTVQKTDCIMGQYMVITTYYVL
jgi:hypothetical protein